MSTSKARACPNFLTRRPPELGDHQPYTTTAQDFQPKKGHFEGVVYKLSDPKRRAKYTPPRGLHRRCSTWFLWGWCADCGARPKDPGCLRDVRPESFLFRLVFPVPDHKGAIPAVRLGLSGRNSGKIQERPRKRSQSVSWNSAREYSWDAPSPIVQGI